MFKRGHRWGETLPGNLSTWAGHESSGLKRDGRKESRRKATVLEAKTPPAADNGAGNYCQRCGCWRGELGSEPTIAQHLANLVEVFREVRRVLRPDGSLWMNYGEMYSSEGGGRTQGQTGKRAGRAYTAERLGVEPGGGLKAKDLVGMPWRVAFALQDDGWWLRAACPWIKSNALPESATDRPTCAVEYLFLFTKSPSYYYDPEAVRMPGTGIAGGPSTSAILAYENGDEHFRTHLNLRGGVAYHTRARRQSDWFFESLKGDFQGMLTDEDGEPLAFVVNPEPTSEKHYASYSPKLVEPCIRASSSEHGVCATCSAPWVRVVENGQLAGEARIQSGPRPAADMRNISPTGLARTNGRTWRERIERGWSPSCKCEQTTPIPATICDPFSGTASTGAAAIRNGRSYIGIELNPEYQAIAERRLSALAAQGTLALPEWGPRPIATSGRLPLEV